MDGILVDERASGGDVDVRSYGDGGAMSSLGTACGDAGSSLQTGKFSAQFLDGQVTMPVNPGDEFNKKELDTVPGGINVSTFSFSFFAWCMSITRWTLATRRVHPPIAANLNHVSGAPGSFASSPRSALPQRGALPTALPGDPNSRVESHHLRAAGHGLHVHQ